jgi:transcriptional regulator with XRE-family HTH domain
MICAPEIRAARGLLGWSQIELAEAASLGVATVRRLENAGQKVRGSAESVWKIQTALEKAGVQFIPADDSMGPGVRLKQVREAGSKEKARARRKS